MTKTLTALATAATLAVVAIATPSPVDARNGWGGAGARAGAVGFRGGAVGWRGGAVGWRVA